MATITAMITAGTMAAPNIRTASTLGIIPRPMPRVVRRPLTYSARRPLALPSRGPR